VIEGVMMRSPRFISVAVRRPAGDLLVETRQMPSLARKWLWLPIVRGIVVLVETLVLGIRAITMSTNAATSQDRRPVTPREMGLSVAAGLALAIALFFIVPTLVVRVVADYLGPSLTVNLGEGVLRIALLVGYIGVIGRLPELRRVYQYHGAEHKAVNAFEVGVPLEVGAVRTCSRFHPRCGTSFILMVMLVSVIVFALLDRPPLSNRIIERLLVLPLVAGISYEIPRLASRYRSFRPLALPGLWLQYLTTREPDDRQLEVAIRALREILQAEDRAVNYAVKAAGAPPPEPHKVARAIALEAADGFAPETIIVGIVCTNGLVVASGVRGGASPRARVDQGDRPAIFDFSFDGARGVLTGEGGAPFITQAKEAIETKGHSEEPSSSRELANLLEDVFNEVVQGVDRPKGPKDQTRRGQGIQPEHAPTRALLLGMYWEDEPRLYTVRAESLAPRRERYAALGSGSALAEYLLARLYRDDLKVEEAVRVAVYVVDAVKKSEFRDGGAMHVAVVGRDCIERKTEEEILDITQSFEHSEERIRSAWKVITKKPRRRKSSSAGTTPRKKRTPRSKEETDR